jgi:hypothetical protein
MLQIPISYVERKIDERFKSALTENEHSVIMVYGTSKQGKSSLRRHVLPSEFCTFVPAALNVTTEGLYREILNQAHVVGPIKTNVEWKATAQASGGLDLPWWLASLVKFSAEMDLERRSRTTQCEIEVDYAVAATVARKYAHEAGCRPIVIDNFHYFSPDVPRTIATDIRAFENEGIKFVIMGTWKSRDYFARANPDLSARICALSIEPWDVNDFQRVISAGEAALNISFTGPVREALIVGATANIGLLQKGLREYLRKLQIGETVKNHIDISDAKLVREVYREISNDVVSEKSAQLRRIADIGDAWYQGKTRTYFIIKAFISDQESNRIAGVSLNRLISQTNELIERETAATMELVEQAIRTLVTRDLLAGQQRLIFSPILAYDHLEDRVIPLDSWLLFTLRRDRQRILSEFG